MKRMKRATKTYRDVLTGEVKRKQRFIQKCPRFMPVQTLTGWIVAPLNTVDAANDGTAARTTKTRNVSVCG